MEVGTNGRQTAAASATRQQRQLEINASTVLFPIAVACGLRAIAATNLARGRLFHGHFRCGRLVRRLRGLGSWLRLTYHGGRFVQCTKGSTTGHVYQADDRTQCISTLQKIFRESVFAKGAGPVARSSRVAAEQASRDQALRAASGADGVSSLPLFYRDGIVRHGTSTRKSIQRDRHTGRWRGDGQQRGSSPAPAAQPSANTTIPTQPLEGAGRPDWRFVTGIEAWNETASAVVPANPTDVSG